MTIASRRQGLPQGDQLSAYKRCATGLGTKASRMSKMNRREFTGGVAAAALYASMGKGFAEFVPGNGSELSMTKLQQQFLDLRFGMYIHLNMATYEQREWGDPKASPALFNPKDLDTDQWAHAARSAGMAYGCLTTNHHDGFCLWPTKSGSANVQDATYH